MDWARVGEVTHYYAQVGVAVVRLEDALAIGDWIALVRAGDQLFEQQVTSMQIEHQNIDYAEAGDNIGLQVREKVKAGTAVYKQV